MNRKEKSLNTFWNKPNDERKERKYRRKEKKRKYM
jgi:hypothetical protein